MNYEAFSRVPSCCGVWKKLKPVNSDRWLRTLLQTYLDEHTKSNRGLEPNSGLNRFKSGQNEAIHSGKSMVAGKDFTPFSDGVWTFGHVASEAARRGISPTFAQPKETIAVIADWWVAERSNNTIKAHHIVASFDQRISHELQRRGYPVDAMLLSSFHQTLSQYGARFYPGETLGWVAGCHHDRAHAHVHALVHPTTASGRLIRMSGLKENEPDGDKFEYLRTSFNTRARQLFVGLTQQPVIPHERAENEAIDYMLMSRYAIKLGKTQPGDVADFAVDQIAEWAGSRDYAARLNEARSSANDETLLANTSDPDPDRIKGIWSDFFSVFSEKRSGFFDSAIGAFNAVAESRNTPTSYSPHRSKISVPLPPSTQEYHALDSDGSRSISPAPEATAQLRREASELRRKTVNAALNAYHTSLASARKTLDHIQVRAAATAAQIALHTCVSLQIPFSMRDAKPNARGNVPHAIPSPSRIEHFAEQELAQIASVEAKSHTPEDPSAQPGLLASSHSPRFRELAEPSSFTGDLTPTF